MHKTYAAKIQEIDKEVIVMKTNAEVIVANVHSLHKAIGMNGDGAPLRDNPDTVIGALWVLKKQWRDVKLIVAAVLVTILASSAWIVKHDAETVKTVAHEIVQMKQAITEAQSFANTLRDPAAAKQKLTQ